MITQQDLVDTINKKAGTIRVPEAWKRDPIEELSNPRTLSSVLIDTMMDKGLIEGDYHTTFYLNVTMGAYIFFFIDNGLEDDSEVTRVVKEFKRLLPILCKNKESLNVD